MSGAPLRPDEIRALESLGKGKVKKDSEGYDTAMQSLASRGMAQEKRGQYLMTSRGKTTLQRRTTVKRGSR